MPRQLAACTLAVAAALATATLAAAGEPQERKVERRVIVHAPAGDHAAGAPDLAQIPGDHLRIDDLASYAPGESRSYTTEGGAEVTIARAEDGSERYTLRAGGKEIHLGGSPEELALGAAAGGEKQVIVRHHAKAGEGTQEVVEEERTIGGLPAMDLMVAGDGPPPLVVEIVGEKDGKATRMVVVVKTVEEPAEE